MVLRLAVGVIWVEGELSMGGDEVFGPGEQLRSDRRCDDGTAAA